MNILIVGNILKDVYLSLDSRNEKLEEDKNGVNWLDLSFDASEHRFFNRTSSFAGAAISLEVLKKLGFAASVANSDFDIIEGDFKTSTPAEDYRYILTSETGVTYFTSSSPKKTIFKASASPIDYLYVDRSANLSSETIAEIINFLDQNPVTKLILYLKSSKKSELSKLTDRASLIFYENRGLSEETTALPSSEKIVFMNPKSMQYLDKIEEVSAPQIDRLTHLSAYSIAAATILSSFLLGNTIEKSLKLAKLNVENSTLSASLSLPELEELLNSHKSDNLELIAASLVIPGKGILAADESGGSIKKKFANLNIDDTFENRHTYRNIFFSTPNIEKYLSGIILFDETARDYVDNGQSIPDFLISKRIIPGIKVDQGLEKFENSEETYTKGLEGLDERLKEYYDMGLRFAKWRAAFNLTLDESDKTLTPTERAIEKNAEILAAYAKKCQNAKIIPIVEPELVYDGFYDIKKSKEVTAKILDQLFVALQKEQVNLRACLLKINMVMAGKQFDVQSTPDEVGLATAEVLKTHVPKELAGVVFLSGGQTPEQATNNLAAILENGPFPFGVTFSFARALQDPALYAWAGNNENLEEARNAFANRLLNNIKALN